MRKGLSEIIAIIMIVGIGISFVSAMLVYYQSSTKTALKEVESQGNIADCQRVSNLIITSVNQNNLTVRNNGGSYINASRLTVYVNDEPVNIEPLDNRLIPGQEITLVMSAAPALGSMVKVVGDCNAADKFMVLDKGVCFKKTCVVGSDCGLISDGCDGTLDCGPCPVCTPGTCDVVSRIYCNSTGFWTAPSSADYCLNCAHCPDGAVNCGETDIDCGVAGCAACLMSVSCTPGDCDTTLRIYCNSTGFWSDTDDALYCSNCLHCTDGVKNCDEAGLDCGGADCSACPVCTPGTCNTTTRSYCDAAGFWTSPNSADYCSNCLHCTDGSQNCGETGVNCGGADCPACSAPFQITDTFSDKTKVSLEQNVSVNTTTGNVGLQKATCGAGHTDNVANCTARFNNPTEDGEAGEHDGGYYKRSGNDLINLGWSDTNDACERGYAEWDVSSIPDGAPILNTVFWYDGNDYDEGCHIHAMNSRPSTSSARIVFDDCADGTEYPTPSSFPSSGGHSVDLGTSADSDLQSKLFSNWFAIGIQGDDDDNGDDDEIWSEEAGSPLTLTVTYTKPYLYSGILQSANLLNGLSASSIDAFGYNAAIPAGTSIKVQFSQDGITWRNSAGAVNGWDTLSSGTGTISLAPLGWSGSSFYYKAQLISNYASTPTLNEISLSGNV